MNLYIDYSEFELTCWNTDGKGTNVAIPLTEEQAKKICDMVLPLYLSFLPLLAYTHGLSGSKRIKPTWRACLCSW